MIWLIILFIYLIMSMVTFVTYAIDKQKAAAGAWRIRENTLHLLELLGGWPGAMAAQKFLRHKTQDTEFRRIFWAIVVLHVIIWALVLYWVFLR